MKGLTRRMRVQGCARRRLGTFFTIPSRNGFDRIRYERIGRREVMATVLHLGHRGELIGIAEFRGDLNRAWTYWVGA